MVLSHHEKEYLSNTRNLNNRGLKSRLDSSDCEESIRCSCNCQGMQFDPKWKRALRTQGSKWRQPRPLGCPKMLHLERLRNNGSHLRNAQIQKIPRFCYRFLQYICFTYTQCWCASFFASQHRMSTKLPLMAQPALATIWTLVVLVVNCAIWKGNSMINKEMLSWFGWSTTCPEEESQAVSGFV